MKSSAAGISLRAGERDSAYWTELVLGRAVPAAFFSLFVADKLLLTWASIVAITHDGLNAPIRAYMFAANQLLGLTYFTLLVVLFATRRSKTGGRRGIATVFVSFFGTFSILLAGVLPGFDPRPSLVVASNIVLVAGVAYSIWSLVYLGRSLSILPEARHLVTGGPYSLSRHPLYLGEGLASIGALIPTIGIAGLVLIACFLIAQYLRLNWEEEVLLRHFPVEYAAYRRHVPRYLPDPRRLFARAK